MNETKNKDFDEIFRIFEVMEAGNPS